MSEDALIKDLRRRMEGAIDALKKELGGLRTGRASVHLLEPVVVEAYGQRMPLNQVGTLSAPERSPEHRPRKLQRPRLRTRHACDAPRPSASSASAVHPDWAECGSRFTTTSTTSPPP